jgi:hypothetical protein
MRRVLTDRIMDPPIRIDDLPAMEQQGSWCMEQYRVRHITSLLALDGRRLVCNFAAPDAEAVRNTLRQLGSPVEQVWPCTVEGPAVSGESAALGPTGTHLICVDRSFADPVNLPELNAQEQRSGWCLDQHGVRFLLTYFAADQRRMVCVYAAPDAEAVRLAQSKAGMPFDRVWAAQLYEATA